MIRIQNLTKIYDKKTVVLDGLSVNVKKGEYIQILGKSGSGKSSLLNILGLLDFNYKGKLYIDGIEIKRLNDAGNSRIRSEKIGFVFQSYNLINNMNVAENVGLPILYSGIKDIKNKTSYIYDVLQEMGIYEIKDKKIQFLSGGEKQRVSIARALLLNPDIILADEPTGNLDSYNSGIVFGLLEKLHKQGKTIILVTHNTYIESGADKKYELINGKLYEKNN